MSSYMVAVFLSLVIGFALAFWAKKQNRDPYRWFLAGALFSVFAVAAMCYIRNRRNGHGLAS